MKATITSTDRIERIKTVGGLARQTEARIWEGVTETGIRFIAYIQQVQVHKDDDAAEFERDLQQEHKQPDGWTLHYISEGQR